MTVTTIDYRTESAAAPAPRLAGALMGALALLTAAQCLLGGMAGYAGADRPILRTLIVLVFGAAVIGIPLLAVRAFVALRSGTPAAAAAMGRFLRFAAYALVLGFLTTLNLESRRLGIVRGASLITALRGLIEVALLASAFFSLSRSEPIRKTCGRTFPARVADALFRMIAGDGAVVILLMLASLIMVLTWSAVPSIKTYGFKFLVTSQWRPNELTRPLRDAKGHIQYDADGDEIDETIPPAFGALAVIYGTIMSSAIALLCAVPLSFGAALFLVRIGPMAPRGILRWLTLRVSFLIEFLAAIPSIAYGIWGLFMLAPFLANYLEPPLNHLFAAIPGLRWLHTPGMPTGRDMLCGGIVLAIMIMPIITAVSRDVLASVPHTQIEGTLALGATWWQSSWGMLRYGKSGLFGAVMLGLARAAGETMAVAMVIGNVNQIKASWFEAGQTMASVLANEFREASPGVHVGALVEVALILLVMSLVFNIIARWLVVGGVRAVPA